ncbi:hypothetical protein DMC30DRAFT_397398 [Rhodotorula diobovata]|uniref:Uncharacterized protein n=1 Tax=Rhodotorula diobovata TaxID=5288 RepID=A0A5C5FUJ6_9BASI|nr:hypothetical protein DMC30DRAFT_397398 [Rhodotorula diobovata]
MYTRPVSVPANEQSPPSPQCECADHARRDDARPRRADSVTRPPSRRIHQRRRRSRARRGARTPAECALERRSAGIARRGRRRQSARRRRDDNARAGRRERRDRRSSSSSSSSCSTILRLLAPRRRRSRLRLREQPRTDDPLTPRQPCRPRRLRHLRRGRRRVRRGARARSEHRRCARGLALVGWCAAGELGGGDGALAEAPRAVRQAEGEREGLLRRFLGGWVVERV